MTVKKDLFKNWIEDQVIFHRVRIDSMQPCLEKKNVSRLRKRVKKNITQLQSMASFFGMEELNKFLFSYEVPSEKELKKHFFMLYKLLDDGVDKFIEYLQEHNFVTPLLNKMEERQSINTVVKKHDDWVDFLFDQDDEECKDEILFTLANKFFEFFFSPETFPTFKKMLADEGTHPIIRLMYSILWTNLAEVGWQHWHSGCLRGLKIEADAGKEIVYIAGGTDIYQLIKNGIYNIRVIDPLLPTQPKYYSQSWDWFVKGEGDLKGIGDQAIVPCGDKNLVMERIDYKPSGETFTIKLSNKKKETIEQGTTVWHLYDKKRNLLGKIIFERRLTNQDDFKVTPNEALLVSFNELYFICAPKESDGWGINTAKFDDDIKMYIKQLENPVGREVCCNFRYEIKQADFAFIELGTCVD